MLKIKRNRAHSVNLFLVELIAVLLFFSVSSAVILNVFSAADSKADKSLLNEKIILCAQSVSETYASNGDMNAVSSLFDGAGRVAAGAITSHAIYMDKSLKGADSLQNADIVFYMNEEITRLDSGELKRLNYKFLSTDEQIIFEYEHIKGGTELFSGSCTAYIPDFEVNGDA